MATGTVNASSRSGACSNFLRHLVSESALDVGIECGLVKVQLSVGRRWCSPRRWDPLKSARSRWDPGGV